ncbi:hypothetical protein BJY01DRAFT_255876 [Aspergillus pseudoustus]|uniref:PH domain-containing protein n=1 Tax=Aspergillus pseudoustus TaxID=1810923 RepID=A0ABR4IGM2_9EURO
MASNNQQQTGAAKRMARRPSSLQQRHQRLSALDGIESSKAPKPPAPATQPTCSVSLGIGHRSDSLIDHPNGRITHPSHWILIVRGEGTKANEWWHRYYHVRIENGLMIYSLAPFNVLADHNKMLVIPFERQIATIPWDRRVDVEGLAFSVRPQYCQLYVVELLGQMEKEKLLVAGTTEAVRAVAETPVETQVREMVDFGTGMVRAELWVIQNFLNDYLSFAKDPRRPCMEYDTCFYEDGVGLIV